MPNQQDAPAIAINVQIAIDDLDGASAVTTDAAMDDAHLRRIVDALAGRLLDAYNQLATKGVDEARALVAQGQVQLAAERFLGLGPSIMRLSRSELRTLTELGEHADVDAPTRLQLLLVAGAAYEAIDEGVLAREAAEKARLLAIEQGRDDLVAAALLTIANTYAREGQDYLARTTYAEVIGRARREGLTDTLV